MDDQRKIDLLKEEYFHLQKTVEEFDSKAITIKAWSVTGSLAAIAAGFSEKAPELFFVGAVASIFFWLVEGYWKTFQLAYYGRIKEIENWFQENETAIVNLQISSSWSKRWQIERKRLFQILKWPHVALPHIIIFIAGLILFFLLKPSS